MHKLMESSNRSNSSKAGTAMHLHGHLTNQGPSKFVIIGGANQGAPIAPYTVQIQQHANYSVESPGSQ